MGRKILLRGINFGLALIMGAVGALAPFSTLPAYATGDVAEVYLTLPDQSKLVERQADVAFSTNLAPQAGEASVRVDPTKTHQTMDGVGAAMTESAAYLFSTKLTANQRALVFPALFSKQVGAGIDVVRVPWGLTDFSLGEYTYNENPPGGTDVPQNNFSINHDQQYIMPRLQDAKTVNPSLKFIAAPWSSPLWMKNVPFPDHPYAVGPLKPEYFDSYGTYLVKAINGYNANNLTPYAFSAQNEPFTPTFNASMLFALTSYQQLLRDNVGPKVAANSVKPKLLSHDEDWQDERDTGNPVYALNTLSDPNAAQYVDGVAYHCYHGESTKQLLVQKAHPTKNIYVTECTGSNTPPEQWDDDFRWGMRNMIINPMRNYARTSLYWNLALDENAGPKTFGTAAGCQNCRGIMTVTNAGGVTFNNEYFILAHYGKFVDPGAQRIDSTTYGEGSIETVAFKNPNGKKTLIALNSGTQPRTFAVREGNAAFRYSLPAGAAATFTWTAADNNNEDPMDKGRIEAENYSSSLPANQPAATFTDPETGKTAKEVLLANNEELRFNNVSLQAVPMSFQIRYRTLFNGTLEFRQDSVTGPLLGSVPFGPTASSTSPVVTGTVTPTAGTHTLYVVAKSTVSGEAIALNWLKYSQTPASTNPIAGKSGWKAYGVFGGGTDVPANVLDSNNSTRWTTGFPMTYGHWFVVDLGKQTVFDTFGAYSQPGDRPHKLRVEISDDGAAYKTLVDNYVPPADLYAIPMGQKAMGRYVRLMELSEDNPAPWWSINEINLYNN